MIELEILTPNGPCRVLPLGLVMKMLLTRMSVRMRSIKAVNPRNGAWVIRPIVPHDGVGIALHPVCSSVRTQSPHIPQVNSPVDVHVGTTNLKRGCCYTIRSKPNYNNDASGDLVENHSLPKRGAKTASATVAKMLEKRI